MREAFTESLISAMHLQDATEYFSPFSWHVCSVPASIHATSQLSPGIFVPYQPLYTPLLSFLLACLHRTSLYTHHCSAFSWHICTVPASIHTTAQLSPGMFAPYQPLYTPLLSFLLAYLHRTSLYTHHCSAFSWHICTIPASIHTTAQLSPGIFAPYQPLYTPLLSFLLAYLHRTSLYTHYCSAFSWHICSVPVFIHTIALLSPGTFTIYQIIAAKILTGMYHLADVLSVVHVQ